MISPPPGRFAKALSVDEMLVPGTRAPSPTGGAGNPLRGTTARLA